MSAAAVNGALIAIASWVCGYVTAHLVAAGTASVAAYALICGWWMTAYVAARVPYPLSSMVPLFTLYEAVFFGAALTGQTWFYRDLGSVPLSSLVMIGLLQGGLICTPIVFNQLASRVLNVISVRQGRSNS